MTAKHRFTLGWTFLAALLAVLVTRLLPHWPNFTAVGAFALGSSLWMQHSRWNGLVALAGLYVTDLVLNNTLYAAGSDSFVWGYSGMIWTYGSWALLVIAGPVLRAHQSLRHWTVASVLGSLVFFVLTNTGSWLGSPLYPQSVGGWISALIAGLPFAASFALSTWLYGALAGYAVRRLPSMNPTRA